MSDDTDSERDPEYQHTQPLAASSWQRNRGAILSLAVAVALLGLGLVVFLVVGNS